jgi:hypothetical protein
MSKRYVVQVNVNTIADPEWVTVPHPKTGTDWMTRRRTSAIIDAAKLLKADGRQHRVVISRPVYEIVPEVSPVEIATAAETIHESWTDPDGDETVEVKSTETTEQVEDSHEPEDEGTCCFKHRQDWFQSQM